MRVQSLQPIDVETLNAVVALQKSGATTLSLADAVAPIQHVTPAFLEACEQLAKADELLKAVDKSSGTDSLSKATELLKAIPGGAAQAYLLAMESEDLAKSLNHSAIAAAMHTEGEKLRSAAGMEVEHAKRIASALPAGHSILKNLPPTALERLLGHGIDGMGYEPPVAHPPPLVPLGRNPDFERHDHDREKEKARDQAVQRQVELLTSLLAVSDRALEEAKKNAAEASGREVVANGRADGSWRLTWIGLIAAVAGLVISAITYWKTFYS